MLPFAYKNFFIQVLALPAAAVLPSPTFQPLSVYGIQNPPPHYGYSWWQLYSCHDGIPQFIAWDTTIHFDKMVLQVFVRELHIQFKQTSITDQKKQNNPKHNNLLQEWPWGFEVQNMLVSVMNFQLLHSLQLVSDAFLFREYVLVNGTQIGIQVVNFLDTNQCQFTELLPLISSGWKLGLHFSNLRLKSLQIVGKQNKSIIVFLFISRFNRSYPFLDFGTKVIYRIQRVDKIVVLHFFHFSICFLSDYQKVK